MVAGGMETWIVTGGAGFIGCNFVRLALAETGCRVVVFDKLTYAGNPANLEALEGDPRYAFVRGDIADRDAVERLYREHRPAAVVNFAAESHVDRSIDDPGAFVRTNVVGTYELLDGARRHLAALPPGEREGFRFLHVSTDEVYGSLGPGDPAFSEETPYAPNSPYSASKAASDHLVRAWHETYGLPVVLSNCSNNYGLFHFPEKLIPVVILNALRGRPIPVYGKGDNVRDWLFVTDHCRSIGLVLDKGRPGETYNVGGNSECDNLTLVEMLCAIADAKFGGEAGLARRFPAAPAAHGKPSKSLIHFVKEMTRICRGRAFYTTPSRLGEYILVDYLNRKRKRIA